MPPMSDSTPPPIPPTPPQPLAYSQSVPYGGMPIAVQAILGTLAAGPGLVVVSIMLLGILTELGMPEAPMFTVLGVLGLATLVGLLLLARKWRRSERTRGWAIGIYIGLCLMALFWGTCALIITAFVVGEKH